MKKYTIHFLLCAVLPIAAGGCSNSEPIYFESSLAVSWSVGTNFSEDNRTRSEWVISNHGTSELGAGGWAIYFNFLRSIDPESIPGEIDIEHINGDFFRLSPSEGFTVLPPGGEYRFSAASYGPLIKEIDAPDGFYIVYENNRVETIGDVSVAAFTRAEQMNRSRNDRVEVPTAESQFRKNDRLGFLPENEVGKITPTPVSVETGSGEFVIRAATVIHYQDGLESEAEFLADYIEVATGHRLSVSEGDGERGDVISLKTEAPVETAAGDDSAGEAYRLNVNERNIEIAGKTPAGVFYGIQSLRSLFPVSPAAGMLQAIESVTVEDAPRFRYRGMHLDVARNFQPVETVERLLDLMALYKLNRFHFHLTDDEGWRLESRTFPELTEIGGRRGHTLTEDDRIYPSYGSGPDPAGPDSRGSGWYSREEYMHLLQFAGERHIEVIPEIDVPGHARAALVAMNERYRRLLDEGRGGEAERFRIHDPADESEYRSIQRWDDNVINVCQESTYRFLEVIFDELAEMHEAAGVPLNSIHIGGDEVPQGVWVDSPRCDALIAESEDLESVDQLQIYFFSRMKQILDERGIIMSGWEEIALTGYHGSGKELNPVFAGSARPYVWSNIWGGGTEEYTYRLANAGYEVILSHASDFYFDMAYDKHPEEAGYYWAGFVDTENPYRFMPFDLYKNAETNAMGHPIPEDAYSEAELLTEEGRSNILGIQGQLWGETFRSSGRVEYMAFPRAISLAERAWALPPSWAATERRPDREEQLVRAWNEFANRLGRRELPRLDHLHGGIGYRLPPPGGVVENNRLRANVSYPGLEIRYTLDGSEPDAGSPLYEQPVEVEPDSIIKLKSFARTGRGSRTVTLSGDAALPIGI